MCKERKLGHEECLWNETRGKREPRKKNETFPFCQPQTPFCMHRYSKLNCSNPLPKNNNNNNNNNNNHHHHHSNNGNNNSGAQHIDCFTSICPQTDVYNHPASLRVTNGQHVESPDVVGFLDRNSRYKKLLKFLPHLRSN